MLASSYNTHKFDFRSKLCVFLGYSLHHIGYRCLHIPSDRVYISKNVIFDETHFPFGLSSQTPTSTPISSLPQSFQVPTASPSTSSHVSSPALASGLTCPSTKPVPSPVAPSTTMVPTAPFHTMQTRSKNAIQSLRLFHQISYGKHLQKHLCLNFGLWMLSPHVLPWLPKAHSGERL